MIHSLFNVRMWQPGFPRHVYHICQWRFIGCNGAVGSSTLQDLAGGKRQDPYLMVVFVERRSKA